MTKIKNTKSNSKSQHRIPLYRRAWFLAIIIIIIIAIIVGLIIFFVRPDQKSDDPHSTPSNSSSSSETTHPDNPQSPTQETTPDGQHASADAPYSDPDQITTQYEGDNPNTANELSGNVSYKDISNGTLTIAVMIDQYISEGECTLTLTGNNGDTFTATSSIFADASTASCEPFAVNLANLRDSTYQIKIQINSNGKQGVINDEVKL